MRASEVFENSTPEPAQTTNPEIKDEPNEEDELEDQDEEGDEYGDLSFSNHPLFANFEYDQSKYSKLKPTVFNPC